MPRKEFLIWLAGLLDGDGSIYIGVQPSRSSKSPGIDIRPVVSIAQRGDYKWVVDYIQKELGFGKVYSSNEGKTERGSYGKRWKAYWQTTKISEVFQILELIQPYLVIKKTQAQKVLSILDYWLKSYQDRSHKLITQGRKLRTQDKMLEVVKIATTLNEKMRSRSHDKRYRGFDYWAPLIKKWYPKQDPNENVEDGNLNS